MTTVFPTSIDALPRPAANTKRDASGFELHNVIDNISDAIEAAETKLGISESSAVDTPAANTVLQSLTNGKSKWATLITAMLSAGAITQVGIAQGATSNPTSTSTTLADVTDMSVTMTTVADTGVLVIFNTSFSHSTATAGVSIAINESVGGDFALREITVSTANHIRNMMTAHLFTGLSAASHTFKGRGMNDVGATLTYRTTQRGLYVVEFKR